jgi:hypothetical protein
MRSRRQAYGEPGKTQISGTAFDFRFRLPIHPVRHSLGDGGSFNEGRWPPRPISKNKAHERRMDLEYHAFMGNQILNITKVVRLP